ncbi:2-C-methyl-D-erythritol 2,4-cyclodiphosphate synthase [Candidatus Sumerlaeota bacterium]|nr:2-C-methyl-D-erythritol 2,4-cyclodiphosphate synthase [Candidatus Sumerlaeota bacterium]
MSAAPPFAVGFGYDVHRFADGRKLMLGGVEVPSLRGLDGHSDADVLLHALCDAVLGAAGLPDIGHFFPPGDEQWRNAASTELLRIVFARVKELGWSLANADIVVIAEKPKIAPHIDAMKARIAPLLHATVQQIGIKATTNERMGFVGREEGIAAMATALLWRSQGSVSESP